MFHFSPSAYCCCACTALAGTCMSHLPQLLNCNIAEAAFASQSAMSKESAHMRQCPHLTAFLLPVRGSGSAARLLCPSFITFCSSSSSNHSIYLLQPRHMFRCPGHLAKNYSMVHVCCWCNAAGRLLALQRAALSCKLLLGWAATCRCVFVCGVPRCLTVPRLMRILPTCKQYVQMQPTA